jgi:phosphoribosylglycinamide formyltransferase-1
VTRVAVLCSGRGTNLQALIDAGARGELGRAQLELVVCNVPGAPALARARAAGIPAVELPSRGRERAAYDAELLALLRANGIELLCLAGYMRLLSAGFIEAFGGPIVNIHPSLLPAFPGLEAQRQALEHGVKVSGATVHFVDGGLDSGPILLQESVPVRETDTPASLAERILGAEHRLYPRAVRIVSEGRYRVEGRRVHLTGEEGAS